MKSAIKKEYAIGAMADKEGTPETRTRAAILVALMEIREAIEKGFRELDQTQIDSHIMMVGCKETFDDYVEDRLKADKVLAGVVTAMLAKPPENREKPAGPVDEQKKSAVTLNVGDFGGPAGESGLA